MSSGFYLPPEEHASFAVSSRLISCLITESLLRGFYLPISPPPPPSSTTTVTSTTTAKALPPTGIAVILSTSVISEQPVITRALRPDDIFAIVPLRAPPVFKDLADEAGSKSKHVHGRVIGLLDPLDMIPEVYMLAETTSDNLDSRDETSKTILSVLVPPPWELGKFTTLRKCTDPTELWDKFIKDMFVQDSLNSAIANELRSSFWWQRASYENPPLCPTLTSPPIEWEQSLVAGHPTHPMHRTRMCPTAPADYNWYHPKIRFLRLSRSAIDTRGPFDEIMLDLLTKAALQSNVQVPEVGKGKMIMPVHEMQLAYLTEKLKDVEMDLLEPSIEALAQSSIRTVLIPDLPNMALKLSINTQITSALRTISHWTADFGPRFSRDVVPRLAIDHRIFSVEVEPAAAIYGGFGNGEVPTSLRKHFTAIFREEYVPREGENIAVVAALLESGHKDTNNGVSAVEKAFGLDTEEKRVEFLDNYLRLACEALIPPALHNGVAFEAHAQNCLLRFNTTTGELLGFVVRDLGGLRVHPSTMNASLGTNFEFLPGHCVVVETLEEIYPKFYHTLIHNHLQRLIRLLGLHHNGVGWEILRSHLARMIPREHGLWKAWMEPKVLAGKCLLRMRLQSVHDKMVYNPFPNMLLYRPEPEDSEKDTQTSSAVVDA